MSLQPLISLSTPTAYNSLAFRILMKNTQYKGLPLFVKSYLTSLTHHEEIGIQDPECIAITAEAISFLIETQSFFSKDSTYTMHWSPSPQKVAGKPFTERWTSNCVAHLIQSESLRIKIKLEGYLEADGKVKNISEDLIFFVLHVVIKIKSFKKRVDDDLFASEELPKPPKGIIYKIDMSKRAAKHEKLLYEGEMGLPQKFKPFGNGLLLSYKFGGTHSFTAGFFNGYEKGSFTRCYGDCNNPAFFQPLLEKGDFRKNKLVRGVREFEGGARFEGQYNDRGFLYGEGTYTHCDGQKIEGEWLPCEVVCSRGNAYVNICASPSFKESEKQDIFIFYDFPYSAIYSGKALISLEEAVIRCHGEGTLYDPKGSIIYQGTWVNGNMRGGQATYRGLVYDGSSPDFNMSLFGTGENDADSLTPFYITLTPQDPSIHQPEKQKTA